MKIHCFLNSKKTAHPSSQHADHVLCALATWSDGCSGIPDLCDCRFTGYFSDYFNDCFNTNLTENTNDCGPPHSWLCQDIRRTAEYAVGPVATVRQRYV